MTADGGQYAFTGLAAGDYTVAIEGWDTDAYSFDMASADLAVADDASVIQNFEGMHTRTASVSGMLFIDEVNADGMHDEGEPPLAMTAEMMAALQAAGIPGVPLLLQGPGINDVQVGFTMPDGSYAFEGLMAGSYRVLINMDAEGLAEAISHFGFRFSGELTGQVVNVAAAANEMVNFPFRIVMQTIVAGAVLGYADAEEHGLPMMGVDLELFANADDADNGTNMLGEATTDSIGMAVFHFARAMDTGPGGQGTDHLVFIKVAGTPAPSIVVSDNAHIEVEYPSIARVSAAPAAVRVLNVMANFQWWVKSNADARDGNEFLEGWTAANGVPTNEDGLAVYSGLVDPTMLPMEFEVMLDEEADQPDEDERWEQSDMLTYTHTGLEHPLLNLPAVNDLGAVYVTWTTQKLTLGVYREADDVEGFSDYQSDLPGGDHRPHAEVGEGMTVELLTRDDRNRLRLYDEWDHDCDDDGEKEKPTEARDARGDFEDGMVTFGCLPADEEFTVRYRAGSGRTQLDYGYDEIEAFGDDVMDFGMTVGAFGDMSGGQPEVRLCSASAVDTTDEWCATFAYQWETGEVHGTVGTEEDHEVAVEPETGHGAIGDEDETDEDGAYSIDGLQDGVYTATAASGDAKFQILGDAEVEGIALYHNEACWADTNPDPAVGDDPPSACGAGEYTTGEDDDGNTTYTYRNHHEQTWRTGRLGLSIKGYVANDGQDGEDRDGLLRGDESMAGITMTLLDSDDDVVTTTETNASGFYSFDDLSAGNYTVSAGTASNAVAIDAIALDEDGDWEYVTSKPARAQDYPTLPAEAELPKPYWDRANSDGDPGSMGQPTTTYTVGTGNNAESATLYNFALVYTDGELSGSVNNLSGSNGSIDIIISTPSPLDDDAKVETSRNGNFELDGLIEAMGYTAEIEDAGFAAPCIGDDGEPDDDVEADDGGCGTNSDGEARERFSTELTGEIHGENDHQNMGTLTVYNERLSADDGMTAIEVMGQTAIGGDDVDLGDGVTVTQITTAATTEITLSNTSAITYSSASVTVEGTIADDASQVVMNGTTACAGGVCELTYNATGSAGAGGTPPDDTITVMVTAENGYNDHAYTFTVTRANPADNVPEGLSATDGDATTTETVGFTATETVWTLSADAGATVEIAFDFKTVDYPTGHALAGDAMWCQTATVTDGGTDVDAKEAARGDECDGMRFDVEMPGTATHERDLTVRITSEDGVVRTTFIRLTAT